MIIGFTGKRGCGKDTAAERLVSSHGFFALDFTRDVLSPILRERKMAITRENLIELAMEGRRKSGSGVWAEKLCSVIHGMKRADFTISGVRFPEEAAVFRKQFGKDFSLVSIACGDSLRYERCVKRGTKGEGGLTFQEFMKIEDRPTERAVVDTMSLSDYALDNGGTRAEFFARIDDLITLIKQPFSARA
ncbi:MAG: AAA family ATPase [Candidatus Aenigmatarchaeota archaeon]